MIKSWKKATRSQTTKVRSKLPGGKAQPKGESDNLLFSTIQISPLHSVNVRENARKWQFTICVFSQLDQTDRQSIFCKNLFLFSVEKNGWERRNCQSTTKVGTFGSQWPGRIPCDSPFSFLFCLVGIRPWTTTRTTNEAWGGLNRVFMKRTCNHRAKVQQLPLGLGRIM